jgi:hypothetical protein
VQVSGLVQVVQALDDFGHDLCGLFERKNLVRLFGLEVEQIAAITVLADQILVVLVFFCADQFHQVWRIKTLHALNLTLKVVEQVRLLHEAFHGDELDCELLSVFIFHKQHLPVRALA